MCKGTRRIPTSNYRYQPPNRIAHTQRSTVEFCRRRRGWGSLGPSVAKFRGGALSLGGVFLLGGDELRVVDGIEIPTTLTHLGIMRPRFHGKLSQPCRQPPKQGQHVPKCDRFFLLRGRSQLARNIAAPISAPPLLGTRAPRPLVIQQRAGCEPSPQRPSFSFSQRCGECIRTRVVVVRRQAPFGSFTCQSWRASGRARSSRSATPWRVWRGWSHRCRSAPRDRQSKTQRPWSLAHPAASSARAASACITASCRSPARPRR